MASDISLPGPFLIMKYASDISAAVEGLAVGRHGPRQALPTLDGYGRRLPDERRLAAGPASIRRTTAAARRHAAERRFRRHAPGVDRAPASR